MKVTKISKSIGYTLNLGNYESMRFDEMMEAELEEGESFDEADMELDAQVRVALLGTMMNTLNTERPSAKGMVLHRLGLEDHNDEPDDLHNDPTVNAK